MTSPHSDMVYVGSTTKSLNNRLRNHRNSYHNRYGDKCGSHELLKLGEYDVNMKLLEEIEIEDNKDPKRRLCEQKWIECTENTCNILRAHGTEDRKEYSKRYYLEHREEILQRQKQYYLEHRQCQNEYQKRYYLEHREEILQYRKQHDLEHRPYRRERIPCECGVVVSRYNMSRHRKSQRHQLLLSKPKIRIKPKIKLKST